jgi:hypothetical protein
VTEKIVKTLAEQAYAHGSAIGRIAAADPEREVTAKADPEREVTPNRKSARGSLSCCRSAAPKTAPSARCTRRRASVKIPARTADMEDHLERLRVSSLPIAGLEVLSWKVSRDDSKRARRDIRLDRTRGEE